MCIVMQWPMARIFDILGKVRLKFMLGKAQFDHMFFILPNLTYRAVSGTDLFTSHRCHLNYNNYTFEVNLSVPQLMSLRVDVLPSIGIIDCKMSCAKGDHFKSSAAVPEQPCFKIQVGIMIFQTN